MPYQLLKQATRTYYPVEVLPNTPNTSDEYLIVERGDIPSMYFLRYYDADRKWFLVPLAHPKMQVFNVSEKWATLNNSYDVFVFTESERVQDGNIAARKQMLLELINDYMVDRTTST